MGNPFYLGVGNSLASLVIVLMAPVLGALADHGGLQKRFLAAFASLGCVMTGALFLVAEGLWPLAIVLYGTAVQEFAGRYYRKTKCTNLDKLFES